MKTAVALLLAALMLPIESRAQTKEEPTEADLRSMGELVIQAAAAGTKVMAVCGPSSGWGYYTQPKNAGWVEDGISNGRLVFVTDQKGEFDLYFRDAAGKFIGARRDGAEIITLKLTQNGDFAILLIYPSTGVTETYAVTTDNGGVAVSMNTTTKPSVDVGFAVVSKISAFVSRCYK